MYPQGSTVRFERLGCPFLGRVMRDDPAHERALIRITADTGKAPQPYSLITAWVKYTKITGTVAA